MEARAGEGQVWGSPVHISKTKPSLAKSLKRLSCETLCDIVKKEG